MTRTWQLHGPRTLSSLAHTLVRTRLHRIMNFSGGRLHLCNRLQAGRKVQGKLQAFMSVQQTGALTPHPGSDAQSRGLMYPILYLCNGLQAGQEEQVKLHGPGSHSCQRSLLGGAQGGTVQAGHICR